MTAIERSVVGPPLPRTYLPGKGAGPEPVVDDLLRIDDLKIAFHTRHGVMPAVDGVSLAMVPGRTLCLVGESGCGKSVTGLAVMGLLPPGGQAVSGTVRFAGQTLDTCGMAARALRGRDIAMIFQNPTSSLNPVHTVGTQLAEVLTLHRGMTRDAAQAEAARLLEMVGIPDARAQLRRFPHQLSGGMAQRVMIAIALACRPRLLIADEPTTALDVTIQAQILDLLRNLQAEFGTAILLITHDLGIVAEMADEVAVMYCGEVVETAPARTLFARPSHPYTRGLLASRPRIDRRAEKLHAIPGSVPAPGALPPGCRFAPRCPRAETLCRHDRTTLHPVGGAHFAACHFTERE